MKGLVVVTGAASGIGLEIALHFKSLGHKVACFDIKEPEAKHGLYYYHCDVSNEDLVEEAFKKACEEHGEVEILVNNSGLQYLSPVDEFPLERWNLLIGVMLTGTFLCSKHALTHMKKNKYGRIINISSVHGKLASPFKAAYVSAKHGVLGLSKVIAKEVAEYNITSNCICPGFVDTPLMRKQVADQMRLNNLPEQQVLEDIFLKGQEVKKLTSPKQVAEFTAFLASESASTITGEAFNISGGWAMGL